MPGARYRAVAPASQRTSSPARIPDWEREEGKLRAWRPALSRQPVISADVLSCSHPRLGARGGETPSMAPGLVPSPRHDDMLLSQTAPGGGDISSISLASSSTTHSVTGPAPPASMTEKLCQCNPRGVVLLMQFSMFYVSISTTACLYAIYLLKFLVPLYPSCRSSCHSASAELPLSQPQFLQAL